MVAFCHSLENKLPLWLYILLTHFHCWGPSHYHLSPFSLLPCTLDSFRPFSTNQAESAFCKTNHVSFCSPLEKLLFSDFPFYLEWSLKALRWSVRPHAEIPLLLSPILLSLTYGLEPHFPLSVSDSLNSLPHQGLGIYHIWWDACLLPPWVPALYPVQMLR